VSGCKVSNAVAEREFYCAEARVDDELKANGAPREGMDGWMDGWMDGEMEAREFARGKENCRACG
jgi:hypothetical protein